MTDNLNSIIHKIQNSQQGIEDLKSFFQPEIIDGKPVNKKEITIDKSTFAIALQHKDTKGAVIHEILLHFVQSPDKQSLENVIKHLDKAIRDRIYAKNNPIGNPNEEFRTHMNFKGEGSNTLLHQAVISNNTEAITSLLKYGANSLIKNKEGKTPLDLTQGKTEEAKKALVDGMKEQAKSKKGSAMYSGLSGTAASAFLGIGCGLGAAIGAGSALAGPSMAIMLGAIAASALIVGIAVGLAIYFLSQDRAQAKAIEKVVNSKLSSINDKMSNMTADDKAAPELPQVSV